MADSAAPTAPTAPAAPAPATAPTASAPASAATPAAPSATAGGAGTAGTPGTATFDALAGTRPRIRRDVLFTETPGGVLFHNADGGFHLTGRTAYRFASLVVPHLTGAHRLADLCAGFGPAQRAMAAELVKTLYARGFARDIPVAEAAGETVDEETAERFAAQIAYVDHYTDDAPARFARYRASRVAVLGDDETAHWCALSLVRNGCAAIGTAAPAAIGTAAPATAPDGLAAEAAANGARVEAIPACTGAGWADLGGYDVVVVTGADAGARTHRLLAAGVPEGVTLIPAWLFGRRLVVGPLATADSRAAGTAPCCASAATSTPPRRPNCGARPPGPRRPRGPRSPGRSPPWSATSSATRSSAWPPGRCPPRRLSHVLVQDLESLDVMAEPVQPHPRCTRCAALPAAGGAASPAALPEGLALPVTATVETARDAEELVEELNRISAVLVRPYTGIFRSYDDEELTQTPLKLSRVEVALGDGGRRRVAAFDVHHLAGARTRALYAAAEAYVEHVVPLADVEDGDRADGRNLRTLGPEALTTGGGTGAVPAAWAVATSLIGKDPVRVPAAALRPFGPHNHDRAHLATAAGSGAGGSVAEAAGRGLLSALAHDALLRAVRGTTRVGPVAVGGDDPELVFLLKSAANLDIAVDLLDLGEADRTSASVVLAREADGPSSAGRWAVGAGLSRRAATAAALRDLLGQVQLAAEDPGAAVDPGDPLMADLAAGAIAVGGESVAADGAETTFDAVLEALRSAGRDALYVSTTPADLASVPVATARVLLTVDGEGGTDAR